MFDVVDWLRAEALPLWGTVGVDDKTGMFVERLDLAGQPLHDAPRRVLVQARQIYAFATAAERGWFDGSALAERAGTTMARLFRADGLPGWAFATSRDGTIADGRRDFYAQAFVLFALAALIRLTRETRWLDLADDTLAFLDARMATPRTGGYAEALPSSPGPRRQNPHMHLLEALLALHEAAPDRGYLARADRLVALMHLRFLHGPAHVLVEFYDDDLVPDRASPFSFEPGHHFEWAWLLAWYAGLGGPGDGLTTATALWTRAAATGIGTDGTVFDEVGGDGTVLKRSTRLWPYTEAARAATLELAMPSSPCPLPSPAWMLTQMERRFLAPAAKGCWIDQLDADGRPLSTFVPASSLYHIVAAAVAIDDAGR